MYADAHETTSEIYKIAENNGIAASLCKAIDMGIVIMVPLLAIMFTIIGFGALQGKITWSVFFTFIIGTAAFRGAAGILEWFMPNMGLRNGCKCAVERSIRDVDGEIKTLPTGLNLDCSNGTEDYEKLHQ